MLADLKMTKRNEFLALSFQAAILLGLLAIIAYYLVGSFTSDKCFRCGIEIDMYDGYECINCEENGFNQGDSDDK